MKNANIVRHLFGLGAAIVLTVGSSACASPAESDGVSEVAAFTATDPGCSAEIGAAEATKLVDECLEVSTETHPPCDAANACQLLRDAIAKGCAGLGANAPSYCPSAPVGCREALAQEMLLLCSDLGPVSGCDPGRIVRQGERWMDEEQDSEIDGVSLASDDACVQRFSNLAEEDGCCGG